MAYETKIKEQEAALKMECRGSHVPEIDIADVFRQLFEDQAVSVTEEEIADLAKMFRAISIEELKLFPGVPEMLQRLKDAGKKDFSAVQRTGAFHRAGNFPARPYEIL